MSQKPQRKLSRALGSVQGAEDLRHLQVRGFEAVPAADVREVGQGQRLRARKSSRDLSKGLAAVRQQAVAAEEQLPGRGMPSIFLLSTWVSSPRPIA